MQVFIVIPMSKF